MNKRSGDNIPYASRRELVLTVALACLNIALFGILVLFTEAHPALIATVIVVLYLAEIAIIGLRRARKTEMVAASGIYELLKEKCSAVLKNTASPVMALDGEGAVLWCNPAMLEMLDSDENPIGRDVKLFFGEKLDTMEFDNGEIAFGDKIYTAESFLFNEDGEDVRIISLSDVTAEREAEKKYNDSRICVAYIAIDNIEDILQYVHEKFRVAVSVVDEKLKSWARSINAVIKSYENDKYVMFFDSVSLDACIAGRFDILDEIRDTRVGDGVSVTVSMGVARYDGSLYECEQLARDAVDMALQRGGDQVVYNNEGVTEYYGGRTKSVYKRSNVRSRTFTNQLTALMARADNVLIMGHRYGDFDSFGASVGIAKLSMICGVKANIAVDLRDKNLEPCIALMQELDGYSQMFVDNADGLDLAGPDTLLVLVDHNIPARAQFADIAARVRSIAIIDHHRKIDDLHENVKISYIEPSASSACELVTEMLESVASSQNVSKTEADMLLAGILLDTKQFTRNTGTRTFGAAQYLRGAGASPTDVYALFKTAPDDLRKEARFHTAITIYRGNIAISSCEGDTDESYRIIASKAADKMLTLRGIDAAFTLVRIGEQIHISGRSGGLINVQLILERLGGGGHFDVAGAQIASESIFDILETLKLSIDDYFEA
ncbi:MAG: DHH family phosphoesterase [Clostridia bacterium]|nr:DHH family phosphoesterase [Clostridia bacterium]